MSADLSALARSGDWAGYFRALQLHKEGPVKASEIPLPEPEHTSLQPWPEGFRVPSVVDKLTGYADPLGWSVRRQYARGWVRPKNRAPRLVHSVALRMDRAPWWAVVVYESSVADRLKWAAETCMIGGPYGRVSLPGATMLREFLAEPGDTVAEWIPRALAEHARRAAEREAEREREREAEGKPKVTRRKKGEMS